MSTVHVPTVHVRTRAALAANKMILKIWLAEVDLFSDTIYFFDTINMVSTMPQG